MSWPRCHPDRGSAPGLMQGKGPKHMGNSRSYAAIRRAILMVLISAMAFVAVGVGAAKAADVSSTSAQSFAAQSAASTVEITSADVAALSAAGESIPSVPAGTVKVVGDQATGYSAVNAAGVVTPMSWWNPFSWPWGKWLKKSAKVVGSVLKKCAEGAIISTLGLGGGTASVNIIAKKVAGKIAIRLAGGPWAYVSIAAGGCIMKNL